MERPQLPLNAMRTGGVRVPKEPLEFLEGCSTHGYNPRMGGAYLGPCLSWGSVRGVCCKISAADGSAVRVAARAGDRGTPESSSTRLGGLLLSGAGESGIPRCRDARAQVAAPLVVSGTQGEVREIRLLPG